MLHWLNTIETIERETGKPFALSEHANAAQTDVPQIVPLAEQGYKLARP